MKQLQLHFTPGTRYVYVHQSCVCYCCCAARVTHHHLEAHAGLVHRDHRLPEAALRGPLGRHVLAPHALRVVHRESLGGQQFLELVPVLRRQAKSIDLAGKGDVRIQTCTHHTSTYICTRGICQLHATKKSEDRRWKLREGVDTTTLAFRAQK